MPFIDHPAVTLEDGRVQAPYRTYVPTKTDAEWAIEREKDTTTYSALLKEMHWTAEDFNVATSYPNFPKLKGRTTPRFKVFSGGVDVGEPTYSRAQLMKWREEFLAFAKKVR